MKLDLNNKTFTSIDNTENGDVTAETEFHYHQEEEVIWAEYHGGQIKKGFLVGKIVVDHLEFMYQHINLSGELMSGTCISYPEWLDNGKIMLHEKWQWTCRDFSSGESSILEV